MSEPSTRPFEVPTLPSMSPYRDRRVEAEQRDQRLREDGFAAGYQAGLDAARRDIELEIADHRLAAQRLTVAGQAFEDAADDLRRRDALTLRELESTAIAIAVDLAGEIVGRELRSTPEPLLDAIGRASALVPDRGDPIVRVHPDDVATAREAIAADLLTWRGQVDVLPDPAIEAGGCIVDVGACRIDAQIGPALDRMRSTLR